MVLKKETTLFSRDEEGNLIPRTVDLIVDENDSFQKTLKGEQVSITPIPRGKVQRLFKSATESSEDRDIDTKIIVEHCVEPSYTAEEVEFLKPGVVSALVNTILFESGIDVSGSKTAGVEKAEDEFAKNS
jgi:hypothetical protein